MDEVSVLGEKQGDVFESTSANTISEVKIRHFSTGNGDLGSVLRSLPNVQFDNKVNSSLTPGEISPAKISISGGQTYQNLFLINGVKMNNDIDPETTSAWLGRPGGRSQGIDVDVSLLDNIRVLDSNVDASYGWFNGGVVESDIRHPKKSFGFKISHQYTNGDASAGWPNSLTKYHLYGNEDDFDDFMKSYDKSNQPEFEKHITRVTIESILDEKWGIIGSFTRKESTIPLVRHDHKYNQPGANAAGISPTNPKNLYEKQDQKRYSYNYMLQAFYDPRPDLSFEFGYTYAPSWSKEYMVGTYGDFYDEKHGGHVLSAKTKWDNNWGTLKNTFSFSYLSDETEGNGYEAIKYWQPSYKKSWSNWANWAREGGHIPGKQTQQSISEKLTQEFKPFKFLGVEHNIMAGVEFEAVNVKFHHTQDFWSAVKSEMFMTKDQQAYCDKYDPNHEWCDPGIAFDSRKFYETKWNHDYGGYGKIDSDVISEYTFDYMGQKQTIATWNYGQFFNQVSHFSTDTVKVSDKNLALFLQDTIKIPLKAYKYGELQFRPGIRYEHNSLFGQNNLAYRFAANYAFPWNFTHPDFKTNLSFGANRYYGRNMYAYVLNEKTEGLKKTIYRRSPNKTWTQLEKENRPCQPYTSKRINGVWHYYHIDKITGKEVEGKDTNCVENASKQYVVPGNLKSPYSDELMVGINQNIKNFNLTAKYIHRNGRKEVVRTDSDDMGWDMIKDDRYTGKYYTTYSNKGKSETDVISVIFRNNDAIEFAGVKNNFELNFDWTQVKRNKQGYTTRYLLSDENEFVMYGGKLIRWADRPVDNFLQPWTIKLNTTHEWGMLGGEWFVNNYFSYKKGYKSYAQTGKLNPKDYGLQQSELKEYSVLNLPGKFTWDMKIGAKYDVYNGNKFFVNLDIYNVTNKRNIGLASYSNKTGDYKPTYDTGRQVWIEFGYEF